MKNLLKKLRRILKKLRDECLYASINSESITIRPYRCGQNAKFLTKLMQEIDQCLLADSKSHSKSHKESHNLPTTKTTWDKRHFQPSNN